MARERHFVKYTFLKVDPAWRRLDADERAEHKREFIAACENFAQERLLRAFSTVGTRGDADMMLLTQATNLDRIHEFHVVLAQSGLMKWCSIPYSYLALTKESEYSDESRLEVRPAKGRYLFRSEEHTSELQSRQYLVCRLLLEKKKLEAHGLRQVQVLNRGETPDWHT